MEKIGKFDFTVGADQLDERGRLSVCAVTAQMLDCAGKHAAARGFGLSAVHEKKSTWVVSRLAIELEEMPAAGESYRVLTWVENVYRQFTNRCFEIQDAEGKVLGRARSIWAMIDLETRKSEDLHLLYGEGLQDYVCDRPCPIADPARIRLTRPQLVASAPVVGEDIDFNGHVNSVRYIGHILSLPELAGKTVRRLDVAYVNEALMGDELQFYLQQDEDQSASVELKNRNGQVICRAMVRSC